jgi:hypothetical protein
MSALRLRTFYLNSLLSEENIETYNSSNSIIVSKNLFEEITPGNVYILGLYYNNKKIFVDIKDSHYDEPDIIYVPLWIYQHFEYKDDDLVNYMHVHPKTGNKIKIRPRDNFYSFLDNPVTALRNGFEQYSCLIKGTVIPININGKELDVEILDTYMNNQPIYIRGIELEVDIQELENKNQKEDKKVNKEPEFDFDEPMIPSLNTNVLNKFPGTGHKL